MFTLRKEDLKKLLNKWSESFQVYAPQKSYKESMLLPYEEDKLDLEYVNFASPVKEYLFKQKERMFRWENNKEIININGNENLKESKSILFGIRPCDVQGIAYMDKFFLQGYKDKIYEQSRKNIAIVAMNCNTPGENCFCSSMGSGPFTNTGYDVLFTLIDDLFLVEVGSAKGEELVKLAEELFVEAEDNIIIEKNRLREESLSKFNSNVDPENIGVLLENNFEHPMWDELAKDCIGCTGCTNLCPTCTCFNVVEEKKSSNSGERVRYWDSCQSDSFTRNAGEHNPRNSISRVRYRIYDKFKYIEEKFGMKGCTGCGRCIDVCPAEINVLNIINKLSEKENINLSKKLEKIDNHDHTHDHKETCEETYKPEVAVITDIIDETRNIKRFIMQYEDKSLHEDFKFKGQFFEITVFGVGEIAISIPFSPSVKDHFEFCIKSVGKVTKAMHNMSIGEKVGLRGPFGKGFPYEEFKGRDVIIIGSGVGLAPVRTMIMSIIENRKEFGKVVIIGSALSYEDLIYKDDLLAWAKVEGVDVLYALNKPTSKVQAHVGYINDLLPDLELDWKNTSAIICASPRRIKATAKDLLQLGMKGTDIYTSLETHMRCGIGKCGHCKVGDKYMCIDGPVFNYEEMMKLPPEF